MFHRMDIFTFTHHSQQQKILGRQLSPPRKLDHNNMVPEGFHWARLSGKSKATDCRRMSRSVVRGGVSATTDSRILMWFSNSKPQINMTVLLIKKNRYNVDINMSLNPVSHPHKLKSCAYIAQSFSESTPAWVKQNLP